jgi:hypothetical protein
VLAHHNPPLRRNCAFRWLLSSSSLSMFGSRLTTIAYPLLILALHGSPVIAGLAVFAANVPSVLLYMPAGALVDRWPSPKRTLVIAETGRGAAIAVIVCSLALHRPGMPLIIGMASIEESLEVFAVLAERRYVRDLVESAQASSAQVSLEVRAHVVVLAGRSIGGLLFGLGQVLPFLADFLSFAVSVASLSAIPYPKERPARPVQDGGSNLWEEVRDGSRQLLRDRFARSACLISASMTLISQALIIVFVTAAHSQHVSSVTIGSVLAASGVGGLLGALVSKRVQRPVGMSPLRLQPVVWACMLFILAVMGPLQVPFMEVVMMVFGLAGAMGNVELNTYLAVHVPDKKLARVASIEMLLDFTAGALGPALGGMLAELCGTETAVWTLFALSALIVAILAVRLRVPPANVPGPLTDVASPVRLSPAVTLAGDTLAFTSRQAGVRPAPAGYLVENAWLQRDRTQAGVR